MVWISKRVISYLKEQSSLTSILGSANNIFVESAPIRKEKYVTVSVNIGRDQNSIPLDRGTLNITAVASRNNADAIDSCLQIVGILDDLLNKSELALTGSGYIIIHFLRIDDSGLQVDDSTEEFYFSLVFEFILVKG